MDNILIKINLITDSQFVSFGDYISLLPPQYTSGGEDNLLNVVESSINGYYRSINGDPNRLTSIKNEKTISISLVAESTNLNKITSEIKKILEEIFASSSTTKLNIPKKPDFYLSNDDFLDEEYEIRYSVNPLSVEDDQQSEEEEEQTDTENTDTNNQDDNNSRINPISDPVSPGVKSIFKNEIKAKKITFNTPANESEQKEIAESLGILPFLWYNSYQIDYVDIQFLELSISNGLPTLKTTFIDTFNKMKDEGFPLDDTKISLFLNPRSQVLKPIHIDFKIVNFSVSGNSYTITGLIDVPNLYIKSYQSISKKTSYHALQEIARNCLLGFNSNIDDTNDNMTWINTGDRVMDFIDKITEVSYKSDETFLISYIDYYYNLNYVDLEKELNRDLKQELGIGNVGLEEILKIDKKEQIKNIFLTNDESQKESNGYFSSYRIINNSTLISLQEGYQTRVKYYDQLLKEFLIFDIDSITTKGNDKIILKGSPQDEQFYNKNTNLIYTGKIDTSNVHKNFNYSYVQNNRNLVDLSKISLEINMASPNYNLYRFQKVILVISSDSSSPSADMINNRLSGEWLIIDISFKFDGNNFSQIIRLVKRELELSAKEYDNELQSNQKKEKGEDTSNNTDNVNNTENPTEPIPASEQQNNQQNDSDDFPLTRQMWEAIYKGRGINQRVIQLYYQPLKEILIQYDIKSKERIAAFLAQVNHETGFLFNVSELGSGSQYEGRTQLGNTEPGDGVKFKGRGLIQLTGRTNYQNAGKFFRKDFLNNPTQVASDNETHRKGAATSEQITNSILTAVKFWLNSPRKNLNRFADAMSIKEEMGLGSASITDLPDKNIDGKKFGTKNENNFATSVGGNKNLLNFTIISLAINGGYNGYRDRVEKWIRIRNILK